MTRVHNQLINMNYKNFLFVLIVISLFFSKSISSQIEIKFKIDSEIITNQDIINEINYLVSFNNKLKELSKQKLEEVATNSVIQEKIKIIQLQKIFDLQEENEKLEKILIENLENNLKLKNYKALKNYFLNFNVGIDDVLYKLKLEFLWNEFIYKNYINKVNIDNEKLKKKINLDIKNKSSINEFFLREILFKLEENENLEKKYESIIKTIKEKSFENAANIFSISSSAKKGGELGWIKKTQLNEKLANTIKTLEIGGTTKPIKVGNGYLLIKLEDKREINTKINFEEELKNLTRKETDRQLNQYSIIFFNKLKKNVIINEL